MADDTTTVAALRSLVQHFVHARDWEKFQRPANLAKAISVEAAELLELFQWREDGEPMDSVMRARVEEELADVAIYCLSTANAMGLDLSEAITRKIRDDERRYPAGKWKGRARDPSREK